MSNDAVVGIDLGTTNSSIAVIRSDGRPEVLTDGDDGLVPSCVGVDALGRIVVGTRARNQAAAFPDRTVLSIKRRMGLADRVRLDRREYSPQEVSAFILKSLAERARAALGRDVSRAVVTVPAYFTDAQRRATREAGELAGLQVDRIINEPTAASLAFRGQEEGARKILVYDLGGGTFDVSVVAMEAGVVEVLATAGDNRLGGDDFDALVAERLYRHVLKAAGASDVDDPRLAHARLRLIAEEAKKRLSFAPYAEIEEDNVAEVGGRPVHLTCELSRADFEADIKDALQGSLHHVTKALNDAGMRPGELDLVLLVGGSTRIPLVAQLLRERLGHMPHGEIDPDRCVALGAAVQAGMEAGLDVGSVLVDITPYTFGTRAIGDVDGMLSADVFVPIIPRNSKLPITKSEVFFALTPDQERVDIDIYQGEAPMCRDNFRIESVRFEGLNKDRNAYEDGMVFAYSLNVDGILEFTAKERVTGRQITGKVEDVLGARDGPEATPVLGDDALEVDEPADLGQETEQLLKRAEAARKQAPDQDLAELDRLTADLRRASGSRDRSRIDQAAGELAELLFFLE